MKSSEPVVDSVLLLVGGAYSLANIEHVLGIIILVIQISWILAKLINKFITVHKTKSDLSTLDGDVNNVIGTLTDIRDTLTKKEEEDNGDSDEQK